MCGVNIANLEMVVNRFSLLGKGTHYFKAMAKIGVILEYKMSKKHEENRGALIRILQTK
jgi:hypothetical protein